MTDLSDALRSRRTAPRRKDVTTDRNDFERVRDIQRELAKLADGGEIDFAPVVSTPAEPRGIVECDESAHPHTRDGNCVNPHPAVWTPGAGVELLKREHPEMVPEVSEEDEAVAARIIAADPATQLGEYMRKAISDGRVTVFGPHEWQIEARERAAYERGKAEGYRDGILEGRRRAVAVIEDHSEVNADIYRPMILGEAGGSDAA